jgi:hypothetical protein
MKPEQPKQPIKRKILWFNRCCFEGLNFVTEYTKKLFDQGIETEVEKLSLFNIIEKQLDNKYNFAIENLFHYCFIYDSETKELFKHKLKGEKNES